MADSKPYIVTGWNLDNSYVQLPERFYTSMKPTPVRSPKMIMLNEMVARSLGLEIEWLRSEEGLAVLAGNHVPEGSSPLAQAYAGHQFGQLNMLGDGRALLLGEQITPQKERVDVQLKGSGRTPYSRGGDGRAALGPMLREYIISEAMYALGITTTRSLAVVTTGESIIRETPLPGAILTRIAASHLRVGTFQYAARWGETEELQALADYALQRHYPEVETGGNRYLSFLQEVVKRQATLMASWQCVGFIHGVMNTDNMAISGETIDYGPCAFMDTYNPETVFSSIDVQGRYAYGNQPHIAMWNLARFAETLLPLLHDDEQQAIQQAQGALSIFGEQYLSHWLAGMGAKLGLFTIGPEDESLVQDLLDLMKQHRADYTNTFLALTFNRFEETPMYGNSRYTQWIEKWQARVSNQGKSMEDIHQLMRNSNPAVIPRNHRVEEALAAAVNTGDYSVMEKLLDVLSRPFAHTSDQVEYATPPQPSDRPYRTFCGT
jgi:uncharacterized protein YdiU (UPF0061 family)